MNAIFHDDTKLFRLLIEGSANPHMPSDYGCRMFPIHAVFVTKRGHPNLDILQTLLDMGCSPQVGGRGGNGEGAEDSPTLGCSPPLGGSRKRGELGGGGRELGERGGERRGSGLSTVGRVEG